MVCGILAIVGAFFFPIAGIALGIIAIVLAFRANHTTGYNVKTKVGKICGIIGAALSVIFLIVGIVTAVAAFNALNDYASSSSSSSSDSYSLSVPDSGENLDADEQACYDLGVAQLEALKNHDASTTNYLTDAINAGDMYVTDTGATGIDVNALVTWLLTDFDYTYDGVYVYDDGTASLYADITLRDVYELSDHYFDLVSDFQNTADYSTLSNDQYNAKLGELFNQAVQETTDTTDYYTMINFTKQSDGTWAIDQESWDSEMKTMFGLY